MERGYDVGGTGFQAHVLEGFLHGEHVLEAGIRVDHGEQFVNDIGGYLGVGDPQGAVLEGGRIVVHSAIRPGRDGQFAEIGVLGEKAGRFGIGRQVDHGNVIGLGSHDDRAAREGGEQPEGIQLIVAECCRRIVVTHGVSFDLVPHAHVAEEQLTVGERAGAGVAHAHFLSREILDALDPGPFFDHQLGRGAVQPGHGHDVGVFTGIVFHFAIAAQPDMAGIDRAELLFAGIGFPEVFHRAGRRLGLDGKRFNFLDRFVDLDAVGHDLERSTGRTAAEDDPFLHGKGTCRKGEGDQNNHTDTQH